MDVLSWAVLILALLGALATFAVALAAWLTLPGPPAQVPPNEVIAFGPDAEPNRGWDARVGHVRDLMANQDTVTWAVAAISFAAQAALLGFYFQISRSVGLLSLPLVGVAAALVFLLLIARSNWYMTTYMHLLRRTRREEYQTQGPSFPPSATPLIYFAHGGLGVVWLLLLLWSLCGTA